MKTKNITILTFLILILVVSGCNNNITGNVVADEKISVRLPIPFLDSALAPYYVSLDKGFYADEGLDVTLNFGSTETNPVKMVSVESDEFGILGGPDTLLVARSKGILLVAIAVLHRNSDLPVLITLKESNITKVEDLQGKKIGFFYGHISTDVLHNLLNKYDIKRTEINVGADYNQLISGNVDAQWAFRTSAAITLPEKGYEINIISPKDYGINIHGLTLFATEDFIKNNPETVEKFLIATFKGVEYTVDNPDDAVMSIINRDSRLSKEIELKRIEVFKKDLSNSEKYPIGYMDYEMFQQTYERLIEEEVITNEFDVNDAFTTEFIDRIHS